MSKKIYKEYGFSLVELLVIVSIISALAAVVFASFDRARDKGEDSSRLADIQQLELALGTYRSVNGEYPPTVNNGSLEALETMVPQYMSEVPNDPLNDGTMPSWDGASSDQDTYYYWRGDDMPSGCTATTSYMIWYRLESREDGNAGCVSIDDHSHTLTK